MVLTNDRFYLVWSQRRNTYQLKITLCYAVSFPTIPGPLLGRHVLCYWPGIPLSFILQKMRLRTAWSILFFMFPFQISGNHELITASAVWGTGEHHIISTPYSPHPHGRCGPEGGRYGVVLCGVVWHEVVSHCGMVHCGGGSRLNRAVRILGRARLR